MSRSRDGAGGRGLRLLAERMAALPAALRAAERLGEPALGFDPRAVRHVVVTGIGSSAAHARLLAHLLCEEASLGARAVPPGAFLAPPPPAAADDALVVFSQGLSPNARFALSAPRAWRAVVLVTAATPESLDARGDAEGRRLLARLEDAGASRIALPADGEYGTLLRVLGPAAGIVRTLALARAAVRAAGRAPGPGLALDVERACERIAQAPAGTEAALAALEPAALEAPLAFLTSGSYVDLVSNLQRKVLEGLLRPWPPVVDLLELAHGAFQQACTGRGLWIALARRDAPQEAPLLERTRRMLDPGRHAVIALEAELPGAGALLEHEALLNAFVLRVLTRGRLDLERWPGQEREGLLYDLAPPMPPSASDTIVRQQPRPAATPALLAELSWPELAEALAAGRRSALLPLGAIEQHGPHLPFATDAWIAEALAARLCARLPDAVALPVVSPGCSPEHMAHPGTLELAPATLEAVLRDVLRSLARHGFERAFLFSGHGGNAEPLRAMLPRLRRSVRGLRVDAFVDLEGLTVRLHAVAARLGVSAEAAGHHAGEIETSILAALRPEAVRRGEAAAGLLAPTRRGQRLFQPSLRVNAPAGVVGDPRNASARRGAAYLEAWVDLLLEAWARGKKPRKAKGTKRP